MLYMRAAWVGWPAVGNPIEMPEKGNLVSIKAFDWGDYSYEEYPAYAVAGSSEDKK